MNVPQHWTDCQTLLEALLGLTEAAQQAALDAVSSGNADTFAATCQQLAQGLSQVQPALAKKYGRTRPPTELRVLLQRIQTNLDALQATTTRLEVGTRQSLSVLLPPTDQVKQYSRLGNRFGGYGGTTRLNSGYLKA